MTKYYCKQCDPEHKTVYDESWINHTYADGRPGIECIFCGHDKIKVEAAEQEQASVNIKFKGAGWASKDIKLQRDAIKAFQNNKYKRVDE